jgi:hypothetical protein
VITRFYKDAKAASGYVAKMTEAGYDVLLVDAELVEEEAK